MDEATNRLPQVPVNETMNAMPTFDEIQKAARQLSSDKSPGTDSIPAEIYNESGRVLTENIDALFQLIWHHETLPQDFKEDTNAAKLPVVLHVPEFGNTIFSSITLTSLLCWKLKCRESMQYSFRKTPLWPFAICVLYYTAYIHIPLAEVLSSKSFVKAM